MDKPDFFNGWEEDGEPVMPDSKHMMQFKINHLFRKVQSKDDEIERFSKYIAELEANNKQVRTDLLLYVDSNVELHATNERLRADVDKAIELLREGSTKFGEYGDTFMQAGMLNLADALKEDEG